MAIVMMGVSGSGKTVVGEVLARARGVAFCDGDDLHPLANVAKMRAGDPLNDADRAPWLAAVGTWMAAHAGGVVACSALKRRYRDRLRLDDPTARFVLLNPAVSVLRARLANRRGHYMPASLLDSQLATLELPDPDERALVITSDASIDAHVEAIEYWLNETPNG